jgi:hypothetical protein
MNSTFDATLVDVKNGKTKLVIKFDADEIEREELANLNDMIGKGVEVIVRPVSVVVKDAPKGQEYTVNDRGEVDQLDVYDFVGEIEILPQEDQEDLIDIVDSEDEPETEETPEETPEEQLTEEEQPKESAFEEVI